TDICRKEHIGGTGTPGAAPGRGCSEAINLLANIVPFDACAGAGSGVRDAACIDRAIDRQGKIARVVAVDPRKISISRAARVAAGIWRRLGTEVVKVEREVGSNPGPSATTRVQVNRLQRVVCRGEGESLAQVRIAASPAIEALASAGRAQCARICDCADNRRA